MEIWDILDGKGKKTGKTVVRGAPMLPGEFNLVVHVWIRNKQGRYLITKRAHEKELYPDLWDTTCGAVLSGEMSLEACLRETKEETGIDLEPGSGRLIDRLKRQYAHQWDFADVWLFPADVAIEDVAMQPGEVSDARWADPQEILGMMERGEFVPSAEYFEDLFIER